MINNFRSSWWPQFLRFHGREHKRIISRRVARWLLQLKWSSLGLHLQKRYLYSDLGQIIFRWDLRPFPFRKAECWMDVIMENQLMSRKSKNLNSFWIMKQKNKKVTSHIVKEMLMSYNSDCLFIVLFIHLEFSKFFNMKYTALKNEL